MSGERNRIRRIREPDLTRLRGLPRAEAMRLAMIMYGWDATTAAEKVDIEQGRYPEGPVDQETQQGEVGAG